MQRNELIALLLDYPDKRMKIHIDDKIFDIDNIWMGNGFIYLEVEDDGDIFE